MIQRFQNLLIKVKPAKLNWSSNNHMNVNFKTTTTKEMIISMFHCNFPDKLSVADVEIEWVNVFKLFGVHINRSLKWDDHVSAICNKAASRIYFWKQLKRSSVDLDDLYHFTLLLSDQFLNMHAVWHSGLTVEHSNRIEAIQKRAFRLIFGSFDYLDLCSRNGLSTLYERRDLLARQFFQSILNKSSCLNYRIVSLVNCVTHPFLNCHMCILLVLRHLSLIMPLIIIYDMILFSFY